MVKLFEVSDGPPSETIETNKPCWKRNSLKYNEKSKGYLFFSLTHGPEFHASQVANAVLVARQLRATLVLPDIEEPNSRHKRRFEEIYDVNKFITSLEGVIRVARRPPHGLSKAKLSTVRVPDGVSKSFIASKIEPIFRQNHQLKIIPDAVSKMGSQNKSLNDYHCLAAFESLKLNEDLQQLVDSMVDTLRTLSRGHFVAVDLRVEVLEGRRCQARRKVCYNAEEIAEFLKKIGVDANTTVYITQAGWHRSLNPLRRLFPHTYNKDAVMPEFDKAKFLASGSSTYEKAIDLQICSQADVFVPAFPSTFYATVVGERAANGGERVLVPSKSGSYSAGDYVSPFVAKRSHFAYSCFC